MNINFYKVTCELSINGIYCGKRTRHYQMKKGDVPVEEIKDYNPKTDRLSLCALNHTFDLGYDTTVVKERGYYFDHFESVELPKQLLKKRAWWWPTKVLWEDDIESISIRYAYEIEDAPSFERLLKYPTEMVIEYMKERGLAYCPKI